jgi:hypothetical protein
LVCSSHMPVMDGIAIDRGLEIENHPKPDGVKFGKLPALSYLLYAVHGFTVRFN